MTKPETQPEPERTATAETDAAQQAHHESDDTAAHANETDPATGPTADEQLSDETDPTTDEQTPEATESEEPEEPIDMDLLQQQVEAVLMTIERPMPPAKIADLLSIKSSMPITKAVDLLNDFYTQTRRSFRIEKLAGGYQMLTISSFRPILATLHRTKSDSRLSPAAMETLAIVAYRQPILRAEVESVRGVACGEVLRALMDRHLIKIVGRAEEIGRPMLYGTTKRFLEVFGLASLKDLPKIEELNKK